MLYLAREVRKFGDVLAEKKVTLSWLVNSNMVKLEKYDHHHLVYYFKVPLNYYKIYSKNIVDSIILNTKLAYLGSLEAIYLDFLGTSPPEPPAWLCPGSTEELAAPPRPPIAFATCHMRKVCTNVHIKNIEVPKKI